MNTKYLYESFDNNKQTYIYYVDKGLMNTFTGHIEDYDQGSICMECDVVDGIIDGICKKYYFKSLNIEEIGYMKNDNKYGLWIEFYENKMVKSISLVYGNLYYDTYTYDPYGKLCNIDIIEKDSNFVKLTGYINFQKMQKYRDKYNLAEINKEILRDGIEFQYEKYFN